MKKKMYIGELFDSLNCLRHYFLKMNNAIILLAIYMTN